MEDVDARLAIHMLPTKAEEFSASHAGEHSHENYQARVHVSGVRKQRLNFLRLQLPAFFFRDISGLSTPSIGECRKPKARCFPRTACASQALVSLFTNSINFILREWLYAIGLPTLKSSIYRRNEDQRLCQRPGQRQRTRSTQFSMH
jgi:hypothetical protein